MQINASNPLIITSLKVGRYRHSGDTAVSAACVLLVHRAKLGGRIGLLGEDRACHGNDVLLPVLSVLQQRGTPSVPPHGSPRDEDGRGRELTREVVEHVVALEGAVEDEARQLNDLLVGVSGLEVPHEEGVRARDGDLVLELLKDDLLHVEDLFWKRAKTKWIRKGVEVQ